LSIIASPFFDLAKKCPRAEYEPDDQAGEHREQNRPVRRQRRDITGGVNYCSAAAITACTAPEKGAAWK
jgi:hypothetical protein